MASSPIRPSKPADDPAAHVIAEYRHKDLLVTCTCGWQGSSEPRGLSPRPGDSDWSDHRAAMRPGAARDRKGR